MEGVRRDQREHPYVVWLNSGIEASLSELVCEEICVNKECCKSIVEEKYGKFKDLVVSLAYTFINKKSFPFPILDLCSYQLTIDRFLDH